MAGGRRFCARSGGDEAGAQASTRSRTTSSERRNRLQPGWMRRSLARDVWCRGPAAADAEARFESKCAVTPDGSVRWKAPEDSPEAPPLPDEEEKVRIRSDRSHADRQVLDQTHMARSRQALEPFSWASPSAVGRQDEYSTQSPKLMNGEPLRPLLERSRRANADMVLPRPHSPAQKLLFPISSSGSLPLVDRLTPALASARSSSSSAATLSARGVQSARERRSDSQNEQRRKGDHSAVLASWRNGLTLVRTAEVLNGSSGPHDTNPSADIDTQKDQIREDMRSRDDREVRLLAERLAAAERERNWAVAALRDSENSLQSALDSAAEARNRVSELEEQQSQLCGQRCGPAPSSREGDLHETPPAEHQLRHQKVLMELLATRCRMLEERLAYEAEQAGARDSANSSAFAALEDQAARLGAALVEQQRSARAREDALRTEIAEQYRLEFERVTRGLNPVVADSVEEVGLDSSCSSSPLRASRASNATTPPFGSELVQLSESWDSARNAGASASPARREPTNVTNATGEPCWRLHNAVPGLLSAGLPRGSGSVEQGSSPNPSPRRHPAAPASPSNSPRPVPRRTEPRAAPQDDGSAGSVAIATLTGEVHAPPHDTTPVGGRHLLETPASPQFGKFAADESRQSPPRSPQMARAAPSTSVSHLATVAASGASRPGGRETSAPPGSQNFGEHRAGGEGAAGNGMDEADVQLEELQTGLAATTDPKQAARLWARIGTLQQRRKCFNEARQAYASAVQLDGGAQHGSLANLAQLEAHAGNVPLARDLLERAVSIDPSNSAYRAFQQWLLKEGG